MSTIRLPIGIRKQQIYFELIGIVYNRLFNPKYKLERWTLLLLSIDLTFFMLIRPYHTMVLILIFMSIYLIYDILRTLNSNFDITYFYIFIYKKWMSFTT